MQPTPAGALEVKEAHDFEYSVSLDEQMLCITLLRFLGKPHDIEACAASHASFTMLHMVRQVLPPAAYVHQPASSFNTRFVHANVNKVCPSLQGSICITF